LQLPPSPPRSKTVVSIFGINPYRIGAFEIYARELSAQLGECGWNSVLCYLALPPAPVRRFLDLPNVSLEVVEDSWKISWKAMRQMGRILKQYRPEIVHLYFTGFVSAYPWLSRLRSAQQVFFTDQGSRPEGYVPRRHPYWKRLLLRFVNRPISKVICVSNYGYRSFTATGLLPENRFAMIYNSVDIARATQGLRSGPAFRRQYGIAEDRLVVTQVSWLIPEKGVADLLGAARLVVAEEPRAHFVLVGDGSHAAEYKRMASEYGLLDRVTFTGVVEDPLAQGVYAATDVACQMSRWEEVFGYVIAEAMASYRPVVGTRVGGIPELIEEGRTGYIVERGDIQAMADRLLRLLRDPALREKMGFAGRQRTEEKFHHQKNVAQVLDLYGLGRPLDTAERLNVLPASNVVEKFE
jgi:glycosyltransferase involved in cell wall biosynthesis